MRKNKKCHQLKKAIEIVEQIDQVPNEGWTRTPSSWFCYKSMIQGLQKPGLQKEPGSKSFKNGLDGLNADMQMTVEHRKDAPMSVIIKPAIKI